MHIFKFKKHTCILFDYLKINLNNGFDIAVIVDDSFFLL